MKLELIHQDKGALTIFKSKTPLSLVLIEIEETLVQMGFYIRLRTHSCFLFE